MNEKRFRYPSQNTIFKLITLGFSLVLLCSLDLFFQITGIIPKDNYLLLQSESYNDDFSLFVRTSEGSLTIRSDWVQTKSDVYQAVLGDRKGMLFITPGFRPVTIRSKPENWIRIFTLGGSTTYGLFLESSETFSGVLQDQLNKHVPENNVEVINLGCPGLESSRVTILFKKILSLDPDVIIIYSGHNEMRSGKVGKPNVSLSGRILIKLLKVSSITRWLNYTIMNSIWKQQYNVLKQEEAARQAGKILVFNPNSIESTDQGLPNQEYLDKIRNNYHYNIKSMCIAASKVKVPIIFIMPVFNLLLAPDISFYDGKSSDRATFDELLNRAKKQLLNNKPIEALHYTDQAMKISPNHAMVWYIRGISHLALGNKDEAILQLHKASDLNIHRNRITSDLETTLQEVVKETGTICIDIRPLFQKTLDSASAGELFFDHCHPTKKGHRIIAEQLISPVMPLIKNK